MTPSPTDEDRRVPTYDDILVEERIYQIHREQAPGWRAAIQDEIARVREAGAKEERTRIVAIIDKLSDGYFRAMVNDEAAGDDKGAGSCQRVGRALCDLSSSLEQPATKQESDRDA